MDRRKLQFIHIYSNLALLITAIIWGVAFVAQKSGMAFVGPFTFNTARTFLGSLSLLPVIIVLKMISFRHDTRTPEEKNKQHIMLAKGGLFCGLALFCALSINQYSMVHASAGKAGFITSLYVIFVPLISVFMKKKLKLNVKISVVLALIGLYLLCIKVGTKIEITDVTLLISAFFFGAHIMLVNYYSHKVSSAKLSCLQFFIVGLLSMPLMFIFENPTLSGIRAGIEPILYAGILSSGVAFTLQIFGQRGTNPIIASLILSLESVFAVLGGMVFLGETLSPKEAVGCVFMISAILLSQLKFQPKKLNPSKSD